MTPTRRNVESSNRRIVEGEMYGAPVPGNWPDRSPWNDHRFVRGYDRMQKSAAGGVLVVLPIVAIGFIANDPLIPGTIYLALVIAVLAYLSVRQRRAKSRGTSA